MSINTILKTHAAKIIDHTGEEAVYTPINWEPGDVESVTCNVVLAHDVLVQADGYDATVATLGTTITALVDDVGTVSKGDTFEIDDTTYTVAKTETNDNIMVTLVVK
jgi:hypothetical protein